MKTTTTKAAAATCDLDDAAAGLPAWDFSVAIGGVAHPVRQQSLAE